MSRAFFHFHAELNTFLRRRHRYKAIEKTFDWRASVKDMIESLGVPHAEIELILANQNAVDFNYIVQPGDRFDVYPDFDAVAAPDKVRLRPDLPAEQVRFVLDTHLGRLAAYLRMMGFDTLYRNDFPDDELAEISASQGRVLLTRDVGLLKRSIVVHGYFVRETKPRQRLAEILHRFSLSERVVPFKYCMKCNGELRAVEKAAILDQLPHDTGQHYDEFHQCQSCQQVYWKGPHYARMQSLIAEVLSGKLGQPARAW